MRTMTVVRNRNKKCLQHFATTQITYNPMCIRKDNIEVNLDMYVFICNLLTGFNYIRMMSNIINEPSVYTTTREIPG